MVLTTFGARSEGDCLSTCCQGGTSFTIKIIPWNFKPKSHVDNFFLPSVTWFSNRCYKYQESQDHNNAQTCTYSHSHKISPTSQTFPDIHTLSKPYKVKCYCVQINILTVLMVWHLSLVSVCCPCDSWWCQNSWKVFDVSSIVLTVCISAKQI